MNPKTKKIVKYTIIGAIFATIALFFYRVWKRMRNGATSAAQSVKDGATVMTQNKEGVFERSLARKSEGLGKAIDASADELNLWVDKIKEIRDNDWFSRLINFDFKRRK